MVLVYILVQWFIVTAVTCASISFDSTPGLMRYKEGDDVTFTWRLDTKPDIFLSVRVNYNKIVIITRSSNGNVVPHSNYKGRVFMTVTDKTIKLLLNNVNKDDVIYGVYEIRAVIGNSGTTTTISDYSAELYLFGKPTKPVISGIKDIKEGSDITLSCTSSPTSVPTKYQLPLRYTWTRDDINLTKTLPTRHTVNGYQLMITDVRRDDINRHYTCIAGEDGGLSSESNDVLLRVLYSPGEATAAVVQIGPLIEGENANTDITCSVSDPGYPQAIFKWSKDNQDQYEGEHGTISIRKGSAAVSKHDGTWKCTPSNSVGDGPSAVISVIVTAKARLRPPLPSTLTAVADPQDSFSVTCGFISKPAAIISWTYNNGQLPTSVITQPMTTTASGKKSIVIQKLLWNPDSNTSSRSSAGGQYLCKGTLDLGTGQLDAKQSQMILSVEYGPYEIEFNTSDTTAIVSTGDSITVACNADCKPSCSYQWKKIGGSVGTHSRILELQPAQKVDHGYYICVASNKHAPQGLTKELTLIVTFAPEIISFVPSTSGDILQYSTLNITCEVSSRPDSTITITNINTSYILLSVWDTHEAIYTFDRVHVLDSGIYQCSAANGIKPVTDVTREVILDVKGGFDFCETTRAEEGKALYTNVTISVCLTANPFTRITKDNWTFKPNKQQMVQNLPDNVSIVVEDTSHLYKKYLKLQIGEISESHYGTYTLKLRNSYNMHEMEYAFNLLPEGSSDIPKREQETTEVDSYDTLGMRSTEQSEMLSVYQQLPGPTLTVYNKSDITLQSVIITGDFYDIWNGKLKSEDNVTLDVVIKALKDSDVVYQQYLKEQGAAMCKLRTNDYTITCFGISQDNKYLLMENVSLGNLQMYLREQSDNAYYNVGNDQNLSKLMNFIHQIIKGVKSVFHLQPPALFYCLSASNVLINNQQQCKLTGFATSRAVTEREQWEEEHNKTRPIRWLSPEAIKMNHIKESDIWSLGVLLWEITSLGKQPLGDKTDEEIKQLILSGHRFLKPANCTDELYDIMCVCWLYQPHSRPSVDDVESRFLELTQYEVV